MAFRDSYWSASQGDLRKMWSEPFITQTVPKHLEVWHRPNPFFHCFSNILRTFIQTSSTPFYWRKSTMLSSPWHTLQVNSWFSFFLPLLVRLCRSITSSLSHHFAISSFRTMFHHTFARTHLPEDSNVLNSALQLVTEKVYFFWSSQFCFEILWKWYWIEGVRLYWLIVYFVSKRF